MAVDLTALNQAVSDNGTAVQGAVSLLQQLSAASNDPAVQAQIDDTVSALNGTTTSLADAVTANTPQPPAPPA